VYSTLTFSPITQTRCSEDGDDVEFFDEEFYACAAPVAFLWIMESSIVLLHKRVILVFKDIIYIINILYS
jgi:hypothetical protein